MPPKKSSQTDNTGSDSSQSLTIAERKKSRRKIRHTEDFQKCDTIITDTVKTLKKKNNKTKRNRELSFLPKIDNVLDNYSKQETEDSTSEPEKTSKKRDRKKKKRKSDKENLEPKAAKSSGTESTAGSQTESSEPGIRKSVRNKNKKPQLNDSDVEMKIKTVHVSGASDTPEEFAETIENIVSKTRQELKSAKTENRSLRRQYALDADSAEETRPTPAARKSTGVPKTPRFSSAVVSKAEVAPPASLGPKTRSRLTNLVPKSPEVRRSLSSLHRSKLKQSQKKKKRSRSLESEVPEVGAVSVMNTVEAGLTKKPAANLSGTECFDESSLTSMAFSKTISTRETFNIIRATPRHLGAIPKTPMRSSVAPKTPATNGKSSSTGLKTKTPEVRKSLSTLHESQVKQLKNRRSKSLEPKAPAFSKTPRKSTRETFNVIRATPRQLSATPKALRSSSVAPKTPSTISLNTKTPEVRKSLSTLHRSKAKQLNQSILKNRRSKSLESCESDAGSGSRLRGKSVRFEVNREKSDRRSTFNLSDDKHRMSIISVESSLDVIDLCTPHENRKISLRHLTPGVKQSCTFDSEDYGESDESPASLKEPPKLSKNSVNLFSNSSSDGSFSVTENSGDKSQTPSKLTRSSTFTKSDSPKGLAPSNAVNSSVKKNSSELGRRSASFTIEVADASKRKSDSPEDNLNATFDKSEYEPRRKLRRSTSFVIEDAKQTKKKLSCSAGDVESARMLNESEEKFVANEDLLKGRSALIRDSMMIENVSSPCLNGSIFNLDDSIKLLGKRDVKVKSPKRALKESAAALNLSMHVTPFLRRLEREAPSGASTPKSNKKDQSYLAKKAETQEKRQQQPEESKIPCKRIAAKKVPNFALIHKKAFDRLEDLKQMQDRKNERAKMLLSGQKPKLGMDIPVRDEKCQSRKLLVFPSTSSANHSRPCEVGASNKPGSSPVKKFKSHLPVLKSRLPDVKPNARKPPSDEGKLTRFGFKSKNASKDAQIKAVASKSRIFNNTADDRRIQVKGVRTNRRFELLMQMRGKFK